MWRLFYPLRYFRLRNKTKSHLDAWPTLMLTAILAAPFIYLPGTNFFHSGGFLDKVLLLTVALTAFYVAALVAVATFSHPDLDKTISVGIIALVSKDDDGQRIQEHLSRREFSCYIFGYLAFASMMFSIFASAAIPLSDFKADAQTPYWISWLLQPAHAFWMRSGLIVLFDAAIAHVAVVTSLGLYYLMDRLYRHEPKVLTEKRKREAA